jgi:hypothetical protein
MEMSKIELLIVILDAIFLSIGMTSCRHQSTYTPETGSLMTLEEALVHSGVEIQRGGTALEDFMGFEGQVLFLDGEEIKVYEFKSGGERENISNKITVEGIVVDGEIIFWDTKPAIWGSGSLLVVYQGYDGGVFLLLSSLMGDPLTYEAPADDEPYPPAVVSAIRYLANDFMVDPALIQVLDFTEVAWPDACLGVASPDEHCLQVLTPGWRVMLKASGNVYELRADYAGEQVSRP